MSGGGSHPRVHVDPKSDEDGAPPFAGAEPSAASAAAAQVPRRGEGAYEVSSVLHGGGAKATSLLDVSGGEASSSPSSSSRAGRPRSNSLSSLGALHDVFRTPGEREEYEQRQREVSVIMQANEARRRTRRASEPAGAGGWSGSVGKVLQRMGLEQLEEESSQRGRREPLSGRVRRLSEGACGLQLVLETTTGWGLGFPPSP